MTEEIAGQGHNNPPQSDFEKFEAKLKEWLAGADVWAARAELDADLAPRARDFIDGVKKFGRKADDARKVEKEPHLAASREVDARWKSITDAAAKIAAIVEPKLLAYMKAEQKKADDARREAEARARAAEDAQRRAEADAATARTDSARIEAERTAQVAAQVVEAEQKAAAAAPVRVESATGLARAAGLKTIRRARIVDLNRALLHYRGDPKLRDLILQLANADIRDAKGGDINIPGVAVDEEQGLAA